MPSARLPSDDPPLRRAPRPSAERVVARRRLRLQVLAIAASRLGFAPVLAIDVDPVAVETTRANAAANGVELDARVVDALSGRLPAADVAVANVLLAPVEAIRASNMSEAITSGYLAGERPAHRGWAHLETMEVDGWAADRFRR